MLRISDVETAHLAGAKHIEAFKGFQRAVVELASLDISVTAADPLLEKVLEKGVALARKCHSTVAEDLFLGAHMGAKLIVGDFGSCFYVVSNPMNLTDQSQGKQLT